MTDIERTMAPKPRPPHFALERAAVWMRIISIGAVAVGLIIAAPQNDWMTAVLVCSSSAATFISACVIDAIRESAIDARRTREAIEQIAKRES